MSSKYSSVREFVKMGIAGAVVIAGLIYGSGEMDKGFACFSESRQEMLERFQRQYYKLRRQLEQDNEFLRGRERQEKNRRESLIC